MFEDMMLRSLHVRSMRAGDLGAGHEPGLLFQASTVLALLDGRYDGDLSFAELARHGDTGLGTLNGLDGEMIALDGQFFRADEFGRISEIPPDAHTPFAVVTEFEPALSFDLGAVGNFEELRSLLDGLIPGDSPAAAIRIDGKFARITARSVPRQEKPYRHLDEVVAAQNIFEIESTTGSLVGFRFPIFSEGIEIAGYHLHYIDANRQRGGHLLDLKIESATVGVATYSDLHVELPPGMDLASPDLASRTHLAIEKAEGKKSG